VRNRGAAAATLEHVHRTATPAGYFDDALARHPNPPATVLRAIRSGDPQLSTGQDIWLAENPALPRDLLERIALSSTDIHVVRALLRRPSLDCALLRDIATGALMSRAPDAELAAQFGGDAAPTVPVSGAQEAPQTIARMRVANGSAPPARAEREAIG